MTNTPIVRRGNFRRLWELPFDLKVHIKAGHRLYASHEQAVVAIDIPDERALQVVLWAELEGTPHRMLAADGKLFVVTREGQIYVFSGEAKEKVVTHPKPEPAFAEADEWTEKAAKILQETEVHDGYALIAGVGTGRLAEELVRQSNCHVIIVDEDAQKVAKLRDKFLSMGLYGSRIVAHVGVR